MRIVKTFLFTTAMPPFRAVKTDVQPSPALISLRRKTPDLHFWKVSNVALPTVIALLCTSLAPACDKPRLCGTGSPHWMARAVGAALAGWCCTVTARNRGTRTHGSHISVKISSVTHHFMQQHVLCSPATEKTTCWGDARIFCMHNIIIAAQLLLLRWEGEAGGTRERWNSFLLPQLVLMVCSTLYLLSLQFVKPLR